MTLYADVFWVLKIYVSEALARFARSRNINTYIIFVGTFGGLAPPPPNTQKLATLVASTPPPPGIPTPNFVHSNPYRELLYAKVPLINSLKVVFTYEFSIWIVSIHIA